MSKHQSYIQMYVHRTRNPKYQPEIEGSSPYLWTVSVPEFGLTETDEMYRVAEMRVVGQLILHGQEGRYYTVMESGEGLTPLPNPIIREVY